MTINQEPLENASLPRQSVFNGVQVGRDLHVRDVLQILLTFGNQHQQKDALSQHVRHNLPQPDYGQFIGREQELTKILQKLRPHPHSTNSVITIDGIGGIGKSALALEVAHRFLREYDQLPPEEQFEVIVWASAKQTLLKADRGIINRRQSLRSLDDICNAIILTMNLNIEKDVRSQQTGKVEIVCRALTQQRTLLIIDNLETIDDDAVMEFLQDLLPAPTKAIITTRHRIDVAYPVRLEGIKQEDGEKLIVQECEKKDVVLSSQQRLDLYNKTGGVPLAFVWTIAKIGFGYDVDAVLRKLNSPHSEISRFCFERTVEEIRDRDSYRLLLVLALYEKSASREELGCISGFEENELDRDDGLVELETLSLANRQGGQLGASQLCNEQKYSGVSLSRVLGCGESSSYIPRNAAHGC